MESDQADSDRPTVARGTLIFVQSTDDQGKKLRTALKSRGRVSHKGSFWHGATGNTGNTGNTAEQSNKTHFFSG